MNAAPLFSLTMSIVEALVTHSLPEGPLGERIHYQALLLLEEVTLAFRGIDQEIHMERADEILAILRIHLRLADRCGKLSQGFVVHMLAQLDEAGRQLGGWQKATYSGKLGERHR